MNSPRRVYASPTRDRQARLTRREILDAATALFVLQGYGRTSVADVAARAGVSAQTVYNAVGTKRDLLKAAYDVVLVGDDEPIPLADRPQLRVMSTLRDPAELLQAYAALSREVLERVGPLMLQIAAGAAAGDSDLIEHQRVTDGERLTGTDEADRAGGRTRRAGARSVTGASAGPHLDSEQRPGVALAYR